MWQVRFWDIASGKEVRQVAASEFAFVEGNTHVNQSKTNHHLLTTSGDTLEITEQPPHGGAPVASFKAPHCIWSLRFHGATICVGCEDGAVCILRVPFLAV